MEECCGTCKWKRLVEHEWCCGNPESEHYPLETEYDDECEEWEER